MARKYHINPRIRAYGKARIDITQRAKDEEDWLDGWRDSLHPFAFDFIQSWKFNVEYKVDDYAAEVGFFIDILGFSVSEFSPTHAQFTTPDHEFVFSIAAALEDDKSTNPETLRIQLMVDEIMDTCEELEQRGITFEKSPQRVQNGSDLLVGYFRTPHGIPIDLWGYRQELYEANVSEVKDSIEDELEMDVVDEWTDSGEEDGEPTPTVDTLQADDLPPQEYPAEADESDGQDEESLELVYEDDEDQDIMEKLIDSFDRFRSSQPLSRFINRESSSKRSMNSNTNRSINPSRYNNKAINRSNHYIQDNP